ncbi:MAG: hypothetical protein M9918_25175 [Anaerolineae bacterium]|nr:hypothetical protein [Anaerolineae bacterium]MCO5191471.1 hypothetical protein [Anaerolineae bacterium]
MKIYALFTDETQLSAAIAAVENSDSDAAIEVLPGLTAETKEPEAEAAVAMPFPASTPIPGTAAASGNPPLEENVIEASSLDNETQTYLLRQVQNGAAVMMVESDHGNAIERIIVSNGGRVWRTA